MLPRDDEAERMGKFDDTLAMEVPLRRPWQTGFRRAPMPTMRGELDEAVETAANCLHAEGDAIAPAMPASTTIAIANPKTLNPYVCICVS